MCATLGCRENSKGEKLLSPGKAISAGKTPLKARNSMMEWPSHSSQNCSHSLSSTESCKFLFKEHLTSLSPIWMISPLLDTLSSLSLFLSFSFHRHSLSLHSGSVTLTPDPIPHNPFLRLLLMWELKPILLCFTHFKSFSMRANANHVFLVALQERKTYLEYFESHPLIVHHSSQYAFNFNPLKNMLAFHTGDKSSCNLGCLAKELRHCTGGGQVSH